MNIFIIKTAMENFWGKRDRQESLRLIATALESGVPLQDVLELGARAAPWRPYRLAFANVFDLLISGKSLNEAFGSEICSALPGWVRVTLSSPMNDIEKGSFIISRQQTMKTGDMPNYFPIFIGELLMVFQFFLVFNMFVLPQFREIFLGMNVSLPLPTQIMMDLFDSLNYLGPLFLPFALVCFGAVCLILMKVVWPIFRGIEDRSSEIIMVTRFLGRVEQARIPRLIGWIAHPAILPFSSKDFSRISDSVKNGVLLVDPFPNPDFAKFSSWVFGMALAGNEITGATFSNLADLEEKSRMGRMKRLINVTEACMVFLVSSMIGFVAISVFICLLKLLEVSQ